MFLILHEIKFETYLTMLNVPVCSLQNTEKTRSALEKLVEGKISAAMPVRAADKQGPAQYIRSVGAIIYVYFISALAIYKKHHTVIKKGAIVHCKDSRQ